MKLRHIIPYIPIIGILYVFLYSEDIYAKYGEKILYNYVQFIWGNGFSYLLSMLTQSYFLWNIFATVLRY